MKNWITPKKPSTPWGWWAFLLVLLVLVSLLLHSSWQRFDAAMRRDWRYRQQAVVTAEERIWLSTCAQHRPLAECQKDYVAVQRLRK